MSREIYRDEEGGWVNRSPRGRDSRDRSNEEPKVDGSKHPDKERNIQVFRKLYLETEGKLPTGMTMVLRDSFLVFISFTPPVNRKMWVHSVPVSTLQWSSDFNTALESAFDSISYVARNAENSALNGLKIESNCSGGMDIANRPVTSNLSAQGFKLSHSIESLVPKMNDGPKPVAPKTEYWYNR